MRTNRVLISLACMVAGMTWLGGAFAQTPPDPPGTEAKADKPRNQTPDVPPADLKELAGGNRAVSLDLYQSLRSAQGNLFLSPYSISSALAMTYAGARGETAKQMATALHFTLPPDRLHPAFNAIDQRFIRLGRDVATETGTAFRLNVVNRLWGQQGETFLPEFLNVLAENYGAGLSLLDFMKQTEPSRQAINQWVADNTQGKIKDLLPPGSITAATRLVLTNAIYFKATWQHQFSKNATKDGPFNLADGKTISVPLMQTTANFAHAAGDGWQAVRLPYTADKLAMLILVPDAGHFAEFEASLKADRLEQIAAALTGHEVRLTVPKFKFTSEFSLKRQLAALGMPLAFSGDADFSGMDGRRDLAIDEVYHKAFVLVDEEGTEAAAATGAVMAATAMRQQPLELTIDRPFIFIIEDGQTGTILFAGRVLNPAE